MRESSNHYKVGTDFVAPRGILRHAEPQTDPILTKKEVKKITKANRRTSATLQRLLKEARIPTIPQW